MELKRVRRAFVDLPHGQVHLRTAGEGGVPLVMLHASPFSALVLEPLVARLGQKRRVIAPDTPGNGDSAPLPIAVPEIADFTASLVHLLDAMGIAQADFYGAHTGARIAADLALKHPARVRKLVFDGFGLYTPQALAEILATYAPEIAPDDQARHVLWAWHFMRDQHLFFPWFKRDAEHRYTRDMPDAATLHALLLEVLKAITTYHRSYRAAFRYSMAEALPRITHPVLLAFAQDDMVFPKLAEAHALLPGSVMRPTPGLGTDAAAEETAGIIAAFLDS